MHAARHLRPLGGLALVALCLVGCERANTPARPNVVVLLADDVGTGDVSPYGGGLLETPSLERLAGEGMLLTRFYATPACGPSRYALLSGRHPHFIAWWGPFLGEGELSLARLFQNAGYATALIGKWHGMTERPESLPWRQGFDYFYGYLMGHSNTRSVWRGEENLGKQWARDDLTQNETTEALDFIAASAGRPFFLLLSYEAGHGPFFASDAFRGRSRGGLHGDMLEELDWSVGQVLDALAEHGLENDTIVIFLSDNGGMWDHSSGGMRGKKGSLLEGGIRVPALVRWPGRISPGSTSSAPGHLADVLPTLARLAGLELPANARIHGQDLSPALLEEGEVGPPHFYWGRKGSREGDLKLIEHPELMLFDLAKDPFERSDLAAEQPAVVTRLRQQLREFWEEQGAPQAPEAPLRGEPDE